MRKRHYHKLRMRIGVYKMYISDFFYRLRHLYDSDEYYKGFEDGYAVAKRNVINNLNVSFLRQWLNEDRITDKPMVSDEDIMSFIKPFNKLKK